jgi:hypothetical protein
MTRIRCPDHVHKETYRQVLAESAVSAEDATTTPRPPPPFSSPVCLCGAPGPGGGLEKVQETGSGPAEVVRQTGDR